MHQNARCQVVNHTRTCSCLPEFAGNALIKCVKQHKRVIKFLALISISKSIRYLIRASRQLIIISLLYTLAKPVKDLCCPSPCGPNSECRQVNNYVACSCKENYIGLPPLCRPECIEDSVCPQSKACIQQKCQDPCIAACGQNAQCLVVNHTRKCECLPGYTGDPLVKCVGEEQLYEKCHTILKTRHYNYRYFFPIRKRDDNNIELKFKVKANRDAHMLFSQDVFPKNKNTAYEIVLGAWNNTGAIIRKTRYDPNTVATKVDDGMLSLNEWREFWIEITNKDNKSKIEIGRKGKSAFLSSEDSKHLPIEYYAVAGSNNATVLWSLPC
ncbi:uncharacterized protein LOC135835958 [Planococcus citri]|uniref:uncharacterized protein LOC135835958 n=1 Tax=Planococcus citri TaxID=170843 RepID=UPI0031F924FB